jgi:hypothetical protein
MSSLMGKAGRGPCQKSSRLPGRLDRKEGSAVGVRNKLSTPVTEAGGRRGGRVPDAIRYPHHHLPSDTLDKVISSGSRASRKGWSKCSATS